RVESGLLRAVRVCSHASAHSRYATGPVGTETVAMERTRLRRQLGRVLFCAKVRRVECRPSRTPLSGFPHHLPKYCLDPPKGADCLGFPTGDGVRSAT